MDRSRRAFLGFLAASPLVPLFWAGGGTTRGASPIQRLPTAARDTLDLTELISSPDGGSQRSVWKKDDGVPAGTEASVAVTANPAVLLPPLW